MIYPAVARILDQFGILKDIHATTTPVQSEYLRWPDGSINIHGTIVRVLQKEFDMPVILFHRQKCVETLYAGLPDKSKVRASAHIEHIEHTATGIKVCLADGTFEEGDLVIGADGVHSLVRQVMWDYAAENEADAIPESDKKSLSVQYKGLFGASDQDSLPGLGPADVHICLGEDTTRLLFTQRGRALWALTYKDEYSQPPKRFRPDKKEQDDIAHRFKDLKITENLTFGQLYKKKTHSGVLNIEEGILEKWHAGRIVLVGDSAHKVR
jgi:2-polyprenyl-6-methoxyphenol hydroxylase-like FAD-dependent oxidoreductase